MLSQTFVKKNKLENGIRIVTEKIPSVRSISIGIWFNTGSRDETKDINGLSHFIEHLMFKGTINRRAFEIAASLESVGGHLNAFTGKEFTCYYTHSLDEHLDNAIDVLADILNNSVFNEKEMEKEKQVILEELNTLEETPEELIHELFYLDLFPNNPLGYSIIGERKNIKRFQRKHVLEFVSDHYTCERMIVAAAGNLDHEKIVKLIEEKFINFKRTGNRNYVPPSQLRTGVNIIENGAIQAHACLGTQAYSYKDERKFGLLVLNTLLGAGMSSRLFQNIREKHGLAYSIYSYLDFLADTGVFSIYVGTDKQKTDDALELIEKELMRLRKHEISDSELERTKSQLKGNLMLGLESTASRMNRLAKMELYLGRHFSLDETLKNIELVSKNNVLDIANELFDQNRLFTTILKPSLN